MDLEWGGETDFGCYARILQERLNNSKKKLNQVNLKTTHSLNPDHQMYKYSVLSPSELPWRNGIVECVACYRIGLVFKMSFFNWYSGGVESNWVHSALRPPVRLLCQSQWLRWWRNLWNDDWQGKPKYSEKTCTSVALSTTDPQMLPGCEPGPPWWEASD
jgi:hypothetical protein